MASASVRRSPRIVVVGPCASGKTSLTRALRDLGYDASVCGQEHSEIATLWRRTAPDVVIALQVDLATIRRRRGDDWPERLFREQQRRLADALAAATLVVDTSRLDPAATVALVDQALRALGFAASP